jgi:hypothetical protein
MFIDADFGQWGLRVLSPQASAARSKVERLRRPRDVGVTDVVLGEFLGDQDLLVVDLEGRPLIAPPLDPRDEWHKPAPNLAAFFTKYVQGSGAKFWEQKRKGSS